MMQSLSSASRRKTGRGFTLIELIIVIAILAILAIAVVLILNPAEILRKGRDSQRISDLSAAKSALALYVTTASTINMDGPNFTLEDSCWDQTNPDSIYISLPSGTQIGQNTSTNSYTIVSVAATSLGLVNGSGWIPTDISGTIGGSPLSTWPVDPSNTTDGTWGASTATDLYYQFFCNSGSAASNPATFRLVANVESSHYINTDKIEEKDGGLCSDLYEVGTNLTSAMAPNSPDQCKF